MTGGLKTTFLALLPSRQPTLEPWLEVVIGGGEESHDGTTRETPPTTSGLPLAETLLKPPPEGLPLDPKSGTRYTWALGIVTLDCRLVPASPVDRIVDMRSLQVLILDSVAVLLVTCSVIVTIV